MPTVVANDIHIYYEIEGTGDPLVFIGGLATEITQFQRFTSELANSFRVISFDNRGSGRSDKPDVPYSIPLLAADTYALLQSLGIDRARVLGVSLGGRIALELTLEHPELVTCLVLVSTSAKVSSGRRRGLTKAMLRIPLVRTFDTTYPQPYYAAMRQFEASTGYDATARLRDIDVPTLILHGKRDHTAPYQLAEEMHNKIPGSSLLTFEGGHLFLFTRPKQFVEAVTRFLLAAPPLSSPENS